MSPQSDIELASPQVVEFQYNALNRLTPGRKTKAERQVVIIKYAILNNDQI